MQMRAGHLCVLFAVALLQFNGSSIHPSLFQPRRYNKDKIKAPEDEPKEETSICVLVFKLYHFITVLQT